MFKLLNKILIIVVVVLVIALVDIGAKAEKSVIDNGLLTKAKSNAETLIKGFLAKGYNLEEYKVVFI